MGLFVRKVLSVPDEFFYLSIIVERFIMYNLVVLNLWIKQSYYFFFIFRLCVVAVCTVYSIHSKGVPQFVKQS